MKRLALLGVAAVAIALALYFVLHTTDKDPSPPATPPDPQPAGNARDHETPAPALPAGQGRIAPEGSATSYTIDGIQIRDHRGSNAGPPMDLPPNIHPPLSHQIPSTLTHVVAKQVQGVLADCSRMLPPEARGPKPRLEGELIVAIKSGKLTVTRSMMQLRDTVGDVEAARSCVEQKSVGLTADAADQPDLDNYSIHVSFSVLPGT